MNYKALIFSVFVCITVQSTMMGLTLEYDLKNNSTTSGKPKCCNSKLKKSRKNITTDIVPYALYTGLVALFAGVTVRTCVRNHKNKYLKHDETTNGTTPEINTPKKQWLLSDSCLTDRLRPYSSEYRDGESENLIFTQFDENNKIALQRVYSYNTEDDARKEINKIPSAIMATVCCKNLANKCYLFHTNAAHGIISGIKLEYKRIRSGFTSYTRDVLIECAAKYPKPVKNFSISAERVEFYWNQFYHSTNQERLAILAYMKSAHDNNKTNRISTDKNLIDPLDFEWYDIAYDFLKVEENLKFYASRFILAILLNCISGNEVKGLGKINLGC